MRDVDIRQPSKLKTIKDHHSGVGLHVLVFNGYGAGRGVTLEP